MAGYLNKTETLLERASVDRDAIARWEDEGGRALAREEHRHARSGDLPDSNPDEAFAFAAGSRARSSREHATRSS